jgi:hypothetical protein
MATKSTFLKLEWFPATWTIIVLMIHGRYENKQTSTILEQELPELGWQNGVWRWSPCLVVPWVGNNLFGSSVFIPLPGLSRGYIDFQKLATENRQTENRHTAVFIELLPQLKNSLHSEQ